MLALFSNKRTQHSIVANLIIAQQNYDKNDEIPDEFAQYAQELDARLVTLQEQEAVLRKQRDEEMSTEGYLNWQKEFDEVNQQIVNILCEQQSNNGE